MRGKKSCNVHGGARTGWWWVEGVCRGCVMPWWFLVKAPSGRAAAGAAWSGVRRAVEVPPAPSLDFMELELSALVGPASGELLMGRFSCFP